MTPPEPEQPLTDLSQLQIPGMQGLWPNAVLVDAETVDRLLEVIDRVDSDALIPREISVNPHQLALELDQRQLRQDR
jgi:hypothetical protein